MNHIPDQMTAVILKSYGIDGMAVETVPVPQPGPGEVLVKMVAAPINPSDFGLIFGKNKFITLPTGIGFEGSGIVVKAGGGMMSRYLLGKRVACSRSPGSSGTWADYMVTKASRAFPLSKQVDLEQGAMSVINPISAIALISIAKHGGHRTFINTAAASMLGQMLQRRAPKEGVQIVHIVRRQEHVDLLKNQGALFVLNSTDEDFEARLREICEEHKIRLALDAISGNMTNLLLSALMPGGKVIVYSSLSGENPCVDSGHFIGLDKSIDGFLVSTWSSKRNFLQNLITWRKAQSLMTSDFMSEIRARVRLNDAKQAATDYVQNMSGGKFLFVMDN